MILSIAGLRSNLAWSAVTGLVFFAFISFRMLRRYLSDETVLAVWPTGLYHAKWSPEPVPWDAIKEIALSQREFQFSLSVWLWPDRQAGTTGRLHDAGSAPTFTIELEPLDGDPAEIVRLVNQYKPVRIDQ